MITTKLRNSVSIEFSYRLFVCYSWYVHFCRFEWVILCWLAQTNNSIWWLFWIKFVYRNNMNINYAGYKEALFEVTACFFWHSILWMYMCMVLHEVTEISTLSIAYNEACMCPEIPKTRQILITVLSSYQ